MLEGKQKMGHAAAVSSSGTKWSSGDCESKARNGHRVCLIQGGLFTRPLQRVSQDQPRQSCE